jgi:hypothetical protein
MSVNFCPDRKRMFKEAEQCIILNRLDSLMSFCNSCLFKLSRKIRFSECHDCKIKRGIKTLQRKNEGAKQGEDESLRAVLKLE